MKTFLAAAEKNLAWENNLNRWAGYLPTPDELAKIEEKIGELERTRMLLEPVGSFRPTEGVYDIGGNAAEWVRDDNGRGQIRGPSAVTLIDPRHERDRPPISYVGFRVVRTR
jgi:formylglycine-generating enzyme required for sulfatase activity